MPRHFLCCLPLRFGVFLLTICGTLAGLGAGGLGWFIVHKSLTDEVFKEQLNNLDNPNAVKIALYVFSGVLTVYGLVSFIGFVGAIRRSHAMLATYLTLVICHFVLSLASGIFAIVTVFKSGHGAVKICQDDQIPTLDDFCFNEKVVSNLKWTILASSIITWLVELYLLLVIRSYTTQLKREGDGAYGKARSYPGSKSGGDYDTVPLNPV